ncbi:MAG: hypothetical protein FJX94_06375 [Bacteroidetes bacterium]|nr:hypothetical protein [Bacteroidota bacterium]
MQGQDSTNRQTIQVTSSFKPSLMPAAKILFNATPPPPAEIRKGLSYPLPAPQWMPILQPITLKPLALQIDSTGNQMKRNFVKIGAGNFRGNTAAFALTLAQTDRAYWHVLGDHIAQRGNLPLQQYRNTKFETQLGAKLQNMELYGKLSYRNDQYFLYGPDLNLINIPKDSLRRNYRDLSVVTGIRNGMISKYGISYRPELKLQFFSDQLGAAETNAIIDLPVEKKFIRSFSFLMRGQADLTRFKSNVTTFNNHVLWANAAIQIHTPSLKGRMGLRPTWENGNFVLLPDLQLDVPLSTQRTTFTMGWIGNVRKNNYQWMVAQNPFITAPIAQFNTRTIQLYAGFKGAITEKINYRLTSGFTRMHHAPLFVNSFFPSRFFLLNETRLDAIQTMGELSYVQQDKLDVRAAVEIFRFFKPLSYEKAFHMLPIQLKANMRWKPAERITVKSDLFIWRGPQVLLLPQTIERLGNVIDLSTGIEYKASNSVALWLQCNNLLNQRYQRWNNYEVLGLNVLGGIRLTFDQKQ